MSLVFRDHYHFLSDIIYLWLKKKKEKYKKVIIHTSTKQVKAIQCHMVSAGNFIQGGNNCCADTALCSEIQ